MSSTHISTAAALIDGDACEDIWRVYQRELEKRRLNGVEVRANAQEASDSLRSAWQAHMSVNGPIVSVRRSPTDIAAGSDQVVLLSTDELAARLHVGERQARRLAQKAGVKPAAKNVWRATDVVRLEALRRSA